ncbi:MAG: hypothetical protein WAZ94_13450 [Phycisphaerales bacterium]
MTRVPSISPAMAGITSRQLASPVATRSVAAGAGRVQVELGEVLASLGTLPPALAGAMAYRFFDLTNNHRRKVIKQAGADFPSGAGARKMLGAGLHAYGRKRPNPTKLADVQGESFAAFGDSSHLSDGFFVDLERGATIDATGWMAVPLVGHLRGGARAAAVKRFNQLLTAHELAATKSGYMVRRNASRGSRTRTSLLGVLVRRRHQRKLLQFFRSWDEIVPKHAARFDRDIEAGLTAAGQARLTARNRVQQMSGAAYSAAYKEFLAMNAGKHAEARKVAKVAAALARREVLGL